MGTRLSTPAAALFGAVLVTVLLAGCAGGGTNTGAPATPGGSVSASPNSSGGPGSNPDQPTSTPPLTVSPTQPAGPEMTLTGPVEEGVEQGCLIMRTQGKVYLLMGGDKTVVKAGATVQVKGRVNTGIMSYCQQGQPFQVSEAHPA
jgi:hypothetical protein